MNFKKVTKTYLNCETVPSNFLSIWLYEVFFQGLQGVCFGQKNSEIWRKLLKMLAQGPKTASKNNLKIENQ